MRFMLAQFFPQRKRELVGHPPLRLGFAPVKARLITTIPVFNGEAFLEQTLASVARQTLKPDRVIVLDNGSTDRTEEIVRHFTALKCEFIRNERNLGLFGNLNRCLDYAAQTDFLHLLHADDTIEAEFYQVMTGLFAAGDGRGLAWALDRRIDEHDQHLSVSGKADGGVESLDRDTFLQRKAELGNQAFCATLLRTAGQASPVKFVEDAPIMADTLFWAAFGAHCEKIFHVRRALGNYRWHGGNLTNFLGPSIQSLILDEWRTMETNEALRGQGWSFFRKLKLKGLLAVRSGIKAKRVRQNGNSAYSREIVRAARGLTGWPLWLAGKFLVELRDFYLFKIRRQPRHPKNIYG
jgi:glycosyltransferase involved in cell wall biosynthesis